MKIKQNDREIEIATNDDDNWINFEKGFIEFQTRSSCDDGFGNVELTEEETRKLFDYMKAYYEKKDKKS